MSRDEIREVIERAITEHCRGGDMYIASLLAAEKIAKALASEARGHYPEEWGPSGAKRLTCVCGNPDPLHKRPLTLPDRVKIAIELLLTDAMDAAVANGANSVSMPDEYVEIAAWLCGVQPCSR